MADIRCEAASLVRIALAFARVEWLETARFKAMWFFQFGWAFLFFLPLALTGIAYGNDGFEASGGGQSFLAFAVIGYVTLGVATSALWHGWESLVRSNQRGTLPHVWTAEAPRWAALIGVTLVNLGIAGFRSVLVLVIASVVMGGAAYIVTGPAVLSVLIALVAFWGMGLAFAGLGLVARGARLPEVLVGLAIVLAGSSYPIGILPWSVRWITYINPFTYVIDLLRATTIGTTPIFAIELEFLLVGAIALASVAGGGWAYAKCERIAIRRGLVGLHA